jgi:predicted RNA-binding protein with PIN domain
VIDGNNLLGSWGSLSQRPGDQRHEVVKRVVAFSRARNSKVILVFDGASFRPDQQKQAFGNVSLRFPDHGKDADSVIRSIVQSSAQPRDWIVVTSDKALYSYLKTLGASILRAHEWNAQERELQRRSHSDPDEDKPDHETDVEGWLRRFGGDQD